MATEYNAPKGADSDLVSRLREAGRGWLRLGRDKDGGLAIEAAERIEALEAENGRLRAENKEMTELATYWHGIAFAKLRGAKILEDEAAALRAELDARAALPHP